MPDPLQRLRGILGHRLPEEFELDNWDLWHEVVRSAAEKHPPRYRGASVVELFKEACSLYTSGLEESIYCWDTRRIEDLLTNVRQYARARQFVEVHLDEIRADIDWARVPRAENEKWDQLAGHGALTIDDAGMCLMRPEADQIIHLDSLLGRPSHR